MHTNSSLFSILRTLPLDKPEAAGIDEKLKLGKPHDGDAYHGDKLPEVPKTLRDATDALRGSKMLRKALGDEVIDHYVHTAEWEQFEYDRRVTDWEVRRGFERY